MGKKNNTGDLVLAGKEFLGQRNFQEARNCFKKAVKQDSTHAEAQYLLGMIYAQQDQATIAIKHISKAVKLAPQEMSFALNLANLCGKNGQFEKAITNYETYLSAEPNNPEVLFYYASTLMQNNQYEKAASAFSKSITINPNELIAHLTLGDLHYNNLNYDSALDTYVNALKTGFTDKELYKRTAKIYVEKGLMEEAKNVFNQALTHHPNELTLWYRLSRIDPSSLSNKLKDTLDKSLQSSIDDEQKLSQQFLLAAFAKKNKLYGDELKHLVHAHSIYEKIGSFARETDYFLNHIPTHAKETFFSNTEKAPAISETSPIFLVGTPRSGSTLIESILCSGPDAITKAEEIGALSNAVHSSKDTLSSTSWSEFKQNVISVFNECNLLSDNQRFTDKSLENIFFIEHIIKLFPNAKIVYCERSPIASVVSILQNNMTFLPWAHSVDNIFAYFDNCHTAMQAYKERYPEYIHVVKYEELIENPIPVTQALFKHCALEWDQSCLDFHLDKSSYCRTASNFQVRQQINTKSLYAFKNYEFFFEEYKSKYDWML